MQRRFLSNYLSLFLQVYFHTPSLAIWRAAEAQALSLIDFKPPILDLACGTGHFAEILFDQKLKGGFDLDANSVRIAFKAGIYETVTIADARNLPYQNRIFRTVFSNCAIEHILGVEKTFIEINRILEPGGTFVFTVPSVYFNNNLFIPHLYKLLRLPLHAQAHIKWYHRIQNHHNINPFFVWQKRLENAGFCKIKHSYYLAPKTTLIFSILDLLSKCKVLVPGQEYQISLQEWVLSHLPRRFCIWFLYYSLLKFYQLSLDIQCGCGLLVVAQKKEEFQ